MGMFLLGWLGGYATWAAVVPVKSSKGALYGVSKPKRGKRRGR